MRHILINMKYDMATQNQSIISQTNKKKTSIILKQPYSHSVQIIKNPNTYLMGMKYFKQQRSDKRLAQRN